MKKILLGVLVLVLFASTQSIAQRFAVDKGSFIIGGTVGFSSAGGDLNEVDGKGKTELVLNPAVGYFIIPNFAVSLELLYGKESQGDESQSVTGIGPAIAYFFGDAKSKTFPFIGADIMSFSSKNGEKQSQFNTTFSAGATAMVSKNVGITGRAYYTMESYKQGDADKSVKGNTMGIEFGVTAFVF